MKKKLKYSVTVAVEDIPQSAPVLLRGEFCRQADIACELGYDAIELQLRDPEKIDAVKMSSDCLDRGIGISAIATGLEYSLSGLSLISDDASEREKMMRNLKLDIELASALDSLVIIGCVRGNIPEGSERHIYWKRFDDGVIRLAEYARELGVTLVIESINYYVNNYLNSVVETTAYLNRLGLDNVLLHIDTHHMNIEDEDIMEAVRQSENHLGYVHFSGANRLYPSPGRFPYPAIQDELRRIGYNGYVALECIPVPDAYTAAKRGIEYLKEN